MFGSLDACNGFGENFYYWVFRQNKFFLEREGFTAQTFANYLKPIIDTL